MGKISDTSRKKKIAASGTGTRGDISRPVAPMLCTLVTEPFSSTDWISEIKFDGFRAIAEVNHGEVRLYSRNRLSFEKKFPHIFNALKEVKLDAVFDGEIVVLNEKGGHDFHRLKTYERTKQGNVQYYIYDLLYLNGRNLQDLPLTEHKRILHDIFPEISRLNYTDHVTGEGKAFYEAARNMNLEGIVMKRANSRYIQGYRGTDWLKIKARKTMEAIVIGYTTPRATKLFGSLVLGIYDNNTLRYLGHALNVPEEEKEEIYARLKPLETDDMPVKDIPGHNIARGVKWVKPQMVCEFEYGQLTSSGKVRHTTFKRLRDDKPPREVNEVNELPLEKAVVINAARRTGQLITPASRINENEAKVVADGKSIHLSSLSRIVFPKSRIAKERVLEYYFDIAGYILPYLRDRAERIRRNQTIDTESEFANDIRKMQPPEWLSRHWIYAKKYDKEIPYALCQNKADLMYLAQIGCIEFNPWHSRIDSIDYPDYTVIDLDPVEIAFEYLIEVALTCRDILDGKNIPSFIKTSGSEGLHIFIPLGKKYTYEQSRIFAQIVCNWVYERTKRLTSLEFEVDKRIGKVYLDPFQNGRGKTIASPYSIRRKEAASVSTPLHWSEVKEGLRNSDFTIFNIMDRLKEKPEADRNFYEGIMGKGIDLEEILF